MQYHEINPMTRVDAQRDLASQDEVKIIDALLSISFHDPDRLWVEEQCLLFLTNTNASHDIHRIAITCLGHLARIHGQLSLEKIKGPLEEALNRDSSLFGFVDDTLGDIRMFVNKHFDIKNIRGSRKTVPLARTRSKR